MRKYHHDTVKYQKEYREKNKEKLKKQRREYYEEHRDSILSKGKEERRLNPVPRNSRLESTEKCCPFCHKIFTCNKNGRRGKQIYCGKDCYVADMKQNGRPVLRKEKAIFLCKQCQKPFTDETKTRTSIGVVRIFCSIFCRARWHAEKNPEWRAKLSANRANRPRGASHERWGKTPHHGKSVLYLHPDGQTFKFRSRWEKTVAEYLTMIGVHWDYEPTRFILEDRTYCPDFWIHEWGCYWEVKGWFHAKHQETIRQFRAMNPTIPIVLITAPWYRWICAQLGKPYAEKRHASKA